jgi:hypothetical protein
MVGKKIKIKRRSANFLKINPGTVQFAVKLKNKYMEEQAPSISDYQASH